MADACRVAVRAHFCQPPAETHAGLVLDRGLTTQDDNHQAAGELIAQLSRLGSPAVYGPAFRRWQSQVEASPTTFSCWYGAVAGRLALGLGNESVLEVGLTLHHTYGVPVVPGSAVKGVVRACARERWEMTEEVECILFGDTDSAGYLRFHDAWWVPAPGATFLAREVTCVHHPDYYSGEGACLEGKTVGHLDLDSPTPVPWVATTGTFLFAIEGPAGWHERARELLVDALTTHGVGAKTAAGYGQMKHDEKAESEAAEAAEQQRQDAARAKMTPGQQALANLQAHFDRAQAAKLNDAGGELGQQTTRLLGEAATWPPEERRALCDVADAIVNFLALGKKKKKERHASIQALREKP